MSPVRYELGVYIPEDGILHSHRLAPSNPSLSPLCLTSAAVEVCQSDVCPKPSVIAAQMLQNIQKPFHNQDGVSSCKCLLAFCARDVRQRRAQSRSDESCGALSLCNSPSRVSCASTGPGSTKWRGHNPRIGCFTSDVTTFALALLLWRCQSSNGGLSRVLTSCWAGCIIQMCCGFWTF
jgi:hypothetical protein